MHTSAPGSHQALTKAAPSQKSYPSFLKMSPAPNPFFPAMICWSSITPRGRIFVCLVPWLQFKHSKYSIDPPEQRRPSILPSHMHRYLEVKLHIHVLPKSAGIIIPEGLGIPKGLDTDKDVREGRRSPRGSRLAMYTHTLLHGMGSTCSIHTHYSMLQAPLPSWGCSAHTHPPPAWDCSVHTHAHTPPTPW